MSPRPCFAAQPLQPKKFLLLDDRNVIDSDAQFVLGKVTKSPLGALIKEEREYEMRFDNMQVSHARACVRACVRSLRSLRSLRSRGSVRRACFLFPVSRARPVLPPSPRLPV